MTRRFSTHQEPLTPSPTLQSWKLTLSFPVCHRFCILTLDDHLLCLGGRQDGSARTLAPPVDWDQWYTLLISQLTCLVGACGRSITSCLSSSSRNCLIHRKIPPLLESSPSTLLLAFSTTKLIFSNFFIVNLHRLRGKYQFFLRFVGFFLFNNHSDLQIWSCHTLSWQYRCWSWKVKIIVQINVPRIYLLPSTTNSAWGGERTIAPWPSEEHQATTTEETKWWLLVGELDHHLLHKHTGDHG